jgi:hypothetical protein
MSKAAMLGYNAGYNPTCLSLPGAVHAGNGELARLTQRQFDWGLGLWWVLATLLGWAVGLSSLFFLLSLLIRLLEPSLGTALLRMLVVGALTGGAAGVLQWLVLRRRVSQSSGWILASVVGYAVGAVVVLLGLWLDASRTTLLLLLGARGGVFGVLVGVMQWLVLRSHLAHAGWWIVASILGWGGGIFLLILPYYLSGEPAYYYGVVSRSGRLMEIARAVAVSGLVAGAVTGVALALLLRQPVRPSPEPQG